MATLTTTIPTTQTAVRLIGAGELEIKADKPVPTPGPYEVLLQVEAVGLCFSDMKLLKQFADHPRKSDVVEGLDATQLSGVQSYAPGSTPTVPGHEVSARIIAVGDKVQNHTVGERVLVQTDYRHLPTGGSNAAFGYNFEGGLQQYVICDERVATSPDGERFLIPVSEQRTSSAVALVEPWACVEGSYIAEQRQHVKPNGTLVVVTDLGCEATGIEACCTAGAPAQTITIDAADAGTLEDESCDDIIYFGADPATIEALNSKLAHSGIINVVLNGKAIGRDVEIGVGRIHYGLTRWVGTQGNTPAESYKMIPTIPEFRAGDRVLVIGAAGPMGQMHVLRALFSGLDGLSVIGTDFDDDRLAALGRVAEPIAQSNNLELALVNPQSTPVEGKFSYIALQVPVSELVVKSIEDAQDDAIINIFAGIPAPTIHPINLDTVIAKRVFLFGTSGSTIHDMKVVLSKVEAGSLDTNTSVAAISGMQGAIDGLKAVGERTISGKIVVYPALPDLGLLPLDKLAEQLPAVADKLNNGQWTPQAEAELLSLAPQPAS